MLNLVFLLKIAPKMLKFWLKTQNILQLQTVASCLLFFGRLKHELKYLTTAIASVANRHVGIYQTQTYTLWGRFNKHVNNKQQQKMHRIFRTLPRVYCVIRQFATALVNFVQTYRNWLSKEKPWHGGSRKLLWCKLH